MNVLFLAPGFPSEMPSFVRGLKTVGVNVIGMGDQPASMLPRMAADNLAAYIQISFSDEPSIIEEALEVARRVPIDRVECLWEPLMMLAARLREVLGVGGMDVETTIPFRDKERMKQVLDSAGIRTPRHTRANSAKEVRDAAEMIGYPIIVKPIAGAGSADTHRITDEEELEAALKILGHVPEVSVEEFIEADEYTFDTVCAGGKILFYNICWYRPRPLLARQLEWVSPQSIALRDPDVPELESGRKMGEAVLRALNFSDGFSHMEWYLTASGEAVFGEIGGRPPGGRTVDIMNFAADVDMFAGWAEAISHGRISQPIHRRYNAASIFKRARGSGRITRIEGLSRLMTEMGEHIVALDLLPPGAHRRNWLQTLISDGMVIVRHPDLPTTLEMADRIGTDLQLYAE